MHRLSSISLSAFAPLPSKSAGLSDDETYLYCSRWEPTCITAFDFPREYETSCLYFRSYCNTEVESDQKTEPSIQISSCSRSVRSILTARTAADSSNLRIVMGFTCAKSDLAAGKLLWIWPSAFPNLHTLPLHRQCRRIREIEKTASSNIIETYLR